MKLNIPEEKHKYSCSWNYFFECPTKRTDNKNRNKDVKSHFTKMYLPSMETINKIKTMSSYWQKMFINHIFSKWLISKIYRDSL